MTTITVAGHVLFDFEGEGFPEISSVRQGQEVDVHYAPKDSPWIYVHTKDGKKGYIPLNYFQEDDREPRVAGEDDASILSRSSENRQSGRTHSSSSRSTNLMKSTSAYSQSTRSMSPYTYINDGQRSSRDSPITTLSSSSTGQITQHRRLDRNLRRSNGVSHTTNGVSSSYHHSHQRSMHHETDGIPEGILKQVADYSLKQCVLVTFHREFVPQISSLLGYFGSQYGLVLNRMKVRHDEVRPYTIAVFEHEDVAAEVLQDQEHLVHDKSRVTKPIRVRVFPLYHYSRVFS